MIATATEKETETETEIEIENARVIVTTITRTAFGIPIVIASVTEIGSVIAKGSESEKRTEKE